MTTPYQRYFLHYADPDYAVFDSQESRICFRSKSLSESVAKRNELNSPAQPIDSDEGTRRHW